MLPGQNPINNANCGKCGKTIKDRYRRHLCRVCAPLDIEQDPGHYRNCWDVAGATHEQNGSLLQKVNIDALDPSEKAHCMDLSSILAQTDPVAAHLTRADLEHCLSDFPVELSPVLIPRYELEKLEDLPLVVEDFPQQYIILPGDGSGELDGETKEESSVPGGRGDPASQETEEGPAPE